MVLKKVAWLHQASFPRLHRYKVALFWVVSFVEPTLALAAVFRICCRPERKINFNRQINGGESISGLWKKRKQNDLGLARIALDHFGTLYGN